MSRAWQGAISCSWWSTVASPRSSATSPREELRIVAWLDSNDALQRLDEAVAATVSGPFDCPCAERFLDVVHMYESPPEGETRFALCRQRHTGESSSAADVCDHFVSRHAMTLEEGFYEGGYVDATYGDRLRATYERILALPPERSDNAGRVTRVLAFARERFGERSGTVLDVGSGLCVFLSRMKDAGWEGTALDPDPRAVAHARNVVGVDAVEGEYLAGHRSRAVRRRCVQQGPRAC